jgi:hypothetical protein
MKKIVTFDFDGTIDAEDVQEYAISLMERGIDVWICTSRFESGIDWSGREWGNLDIEFVAKKLGIDKIIYTNMVDKWEFLKDSGVIWHLDNDTFEIDEMNINSKIKGILIEEDWKEKCETLLF